MSILTDKYFFDKTAETETKFMDLVDDYLNGDKSLQASLEDGTEIAIQKYPSDGGIVRKIRLTDDASSWIFTHIPLLGNPINIKREAQHIGLKCVWRTLLAGDLENDLDSGDFETLKQFLGENLKPIEKKFDFIDYSPIDETKRKDTIRRFVDFMENALANVESESGIKKKTINNNGLMISLQSFAQDAEQNGISPYVTYETLIVQRSKQDNNDISNSVSYKYTQSKNEEESDKYIERMIGQDIWDDESSKFALHAFTSGEGRSEEIEKMIQFVSDKNI